jgi:hypothetical protein
VIYWNFDALAAGYTTTVNLVIEVANTATWLISNYIYGVSSDEISRVTGPPVVTFISEKSEKSIWLPTVFHKFSPP